MLQHFTIGKKYGTSWSREGFATTAHRLVSTPGQFQRDVNTKPCIELVAVSLQGDTSGCSIADDRNQLFATLEGLLLLNIDLQS